MKTPVILGVLLAAALTADTTRACDSASCALVTRGQGGVFARGGGRIDLSLRYVDAGARASREGPVDEVVRAKVDFERGLITSDYHRETGGSEAFLQLDGAYGLTQRLTLVATVPLITQRSFDHVHPRAANGGPLGALPFRTGGFGDVWLGGRYALAPALVAGASVKAPTGSYRMTGDFDGGIQDPMLQPGTGAFDFLGALQYQARAAGTDIALSASYLTTTTNPLDFRFGDDAIVAASVSRAAFASVTASLQIKGHHRDRSRFRGEGVPSTGETSVHIAPGLRVDMPDRSSLYMFVQVPLHRRVNEQQLAARASVIVGFSKAF
jgi:hypothetical protein